MRLPRDLVALRARPGMQLPSPTFGAVVAFVIGYDAASAGSFLEGFREWLIVKLEGGSNLWWPALVVELMSSATGDQLSRPSWEEEDDKATDFLFETIEEFLAYRETNGIRIILDEYSSWLRLQEAD